MITRLASAGLMRSGSTKALDAEVITEWLAKRTGLAYLRIDPTKVDLGNATSLLSQAYAQRLYAALRELDGAGCETILIEAPPDTIEWTAVKDRLTRAAG